MKLNLFAKKSIVAVAALLLFLALVYFSQDDTLPGTVTETGNDVVAVGKTEIMRMKLVSLAAGDGVEVLETAGGIFRVDREKDIIEIEQKIGKWRQLAQIKFSGGELGKTAEPVCGDFECVWKSGDNAGFRMTIAGDSVVKLENIKKAAVKIGFRAKHIGYDMNITEKNTAGVLALDEDGGIAIIPPGYAARDKWPSTFEFNEWKLDAQEALPVLFIGALPPREFDWERSFWPVVHYSSHVERYPSDEQIITWSRYAKVLEMHSWIWQNRYNENDRDEKGDKLPPYADYSFWSQDGKWIPDNEEEFKRVIKTAHANGMKAVPYVSTSKPDDLSPEEFVAEIKRLKESYGIDGVYVDGLFYQKPEAGYAAARGLRELFADDGWLTFHDTHGNGYWAPFINSYADMVVTGEHNSLDRWLTTSYKISNAIASIWPEIPLARQNGKDFLKDISAKSFEYNNRVIFMAGAQGQWAAFRLYFTDEETEFMKEYYLRALEKMKNNLGTK